MYVQRYGAQGETRTHTSQRTTVFETAVAAITPLEHSTPTFNAREAFTPQVGNGLLYNISLLRLSSFLSW